jgi:hypothetical protein
MKEKITREARAHEYPYEVPETQWDEPEHPAILALTKRTDDSFHITQRKESVAHHCLGLGRAVRGGGGRVNNQRSACLCGGGGSGRHRRP